MEEPSILTAALFDCWPDTDKPGVTVEELKADTTPLPADTKLELLANSCSLAGSALRENMREAPRCADEGVPGMEGARDDARDDDEEGGTEKENEADMAPTLVEDLSSMALDKSSVDDTELRLELRLELGLELGLGF